MITLLSDLKEIYNKVFCNYLYNAPGRSIAIDQRIDRFFGIANIGLKFKNNDYNANFRQKIVIQMVLI